MSRVPHARDLGLPRISSQRDAIAGVVGKVLTAFSLAQISLLQRDSDRREEIPVFLDDYPAAKRPWQTFANFTADGSDKAVTAPITFATDVKLGLASLFIGIADLVNSVGKLPAEEPLRPLLVGTTSEAYIVRLMHAVTTQMQPHLCPDPMNCDLGYPVVLRQKLVAIVDDKKYIDPGADALTRLYFNFLKVIAWHAAVIAYEHEHLTLNRATLFAIVGQMSATVREGEGQPFVRDVLSYIRMQLGKWDHAQDAAKAQAAKAQAAKALAAKALRTKTKSAPRAADNGKPAAPAEPVVPAEPAAAPAEPAAAPTNGTSTHAAPSTDGADLAYDLLAESVQA